MFLQQPFVCLKNFCGTLSTKICSKRKALLLGELAVEPPERSFALNLLFLCPLRPHTTSYRVCFANIGVHPRTRRPLCLLRRHFPTLWGITQRARLLVSSELYIYNIQLIQNNETLFDGLFLHTEACCFCDRLIFFRETSALRCLLSR